MRRSLIAIATLVSVTLFAQADKPVDFPEGPAQWIMTAEEKREWRGVKDETRAQELIDLFWARRDPTQGTAVNEFRAEFNERVAYADRKFAEGRRRRGALTERGRVLIVLGFPKELAEEGQTSTAHYSASSGGSNDAMDPTGQRALAARSVWNYEYEQAQKFGMPKIEVVFIHDGTNDRVRRDTQRNDFISALPKAVEYYVKNPDLKTVPAWTRPELRLVASTPLQDVEAVTEPPLPDQPAAIPSTTTGVVARTPRPASIGKLTLVKDAFAIEPQSGADPFASMTNVEEFRTADELGWVAEYCTGSLAPLTNVEVTLKISGLINGERINFNAPPEELVPDSIKASAGCYLVRGAVPLMGMDPANYALFVKIGQHNLTKDFRIIE